MSKKIVVEFDEEGQAKIEAFGFTGTACEAATKFIEEALGKVDSRTKKKEYNAKTVGTQRVG